MISNMVGAESVKCLNIGRTRFFRESKPHAVKTEKKSAINRVTGLEYLFSEVVWANTILLMALVYSILHAWINYSCVLLNKLDFLKRTVDILGSIVGLVLSSPIFLLVPIIIKLDSPGPVFYKQIRVGHNRRREQRRCSGVSELGRDKRDRRRDNTHGRPFFVYKFRTMVPEAEKKCGAIWATKNDPRITRLGRFLRKSRIDEVPQFINVFLGQMSLVGPRPERPVFVKELSTQVDNYKKRLDVKPGITGLAQVENGYDSSIASVVRKVHYDIQYIQKWSIWQDFKIMLRTVLVVVTGKGAF